MYTKLRTVLQFMSCDNKSKIKFEVTTAGYTTSRNLQRQDRRYKNLHQIQEQLKRRQATMTNRSIQDPCRCRIFESRVFPLKGKTDGSYYQPGDIVAILSSDDKTNNSPEGARTGTIVGRIDTDNSSENTHYKKTNCDYQTIDNKNKSYIASDQGLIPDKSSSYLCEKKQQETVNIVTSTSIPVRPRKRKRNQQQQLWNIYVHNQNKEGLVGQNKNSDKSRIEMLSYHNDTMTIINDTNNSNNAVLSLNQFHILFGYCSTLTFSQQHQRQEPTNTKTSETLSQAPVLDIVITSTTDDFRRIANKYSYISNNSCCIVEIGCSTGETSRLLWQRLLVHHQQQHHHHQSKSKKKSSVCWIGFDTSKQMIDIMQQQINSTNDDVYNSIHRSCICMNPLSNPGAAIDYIQCEINKATVISIASTGNDIGDDAAAEGSSRTLQPTIVYIDIGGNRDEYSVLQMIQWIRNTSATMWSDSVQLIVIKSEQVVSTILTEDIRNDKDTVYPVVDIRSGIVSNGTAWLQNRLEQLHNLSNHNNTTDTKSNAATATATMVPTTIAQRLYDDSTTASLPMKRPIVTDTTSTTAICSTVSSTSNMMNSFFPKHPLQAPKRYYKNIIDDSQGILICRYHNYHKDGCKRHNDPNGCCPYDHEHCHFCLQNGHTALQCPQPRQ